MCNCGCYCGSCNCGGIDCYSQPQCGCNTKCSTTTTTTIPCIGENCDELYDCNCVIYNGGNLESYGVEPGTNLCDILNHLIDVITPGHDYSCDFSAQVNQLGPSTGKPPFTPLTYYNVAGCERMEYHVIAYEGNDLLPEGTIVSNEDSECWYITTPADGPEDVGYIINNFGITGCQVCIDTADICSQVWMNKNLDVTTYRNGDTVPEIQDPTAWAALTTGAWCSYNADPSNDAIYGKLYNWYAVNDPRGLAPQGWHIPVFNEWFTIIQCLGVDNGGKMKEAGLSHWNAPNTAATNSSGWTGLPGGYRNPNGTFEFINIEGHWWSSTEYSSTQSWDYGLTKDGAYLINVLRPKNMGASIRCLKD